MYNYTYYNYCAFNYHITGCAIEEFSCHNGTCIPDILLCDDVEDCSNGTFEYIVMIMVLMSNLS